MANQHNYIYSIKGIPAKRAYFARMTVDDLGYLLDQKVDEFKEWDKKYKASTSKNQKEIYDSYRDHTYLDCCCCFVAMAEKLGITENQFTDKQKASYKYRSWEAIERRIIESGLYASSEDGSSWGSSK